jgi:hypothetical protein
MILCHLIVLPLVSTSMLVHPYRIDDSIPSALICPLALVKQSVWLFYMKYLYLVKYSWIQLLVYNYRLGSSVCIILCNLDYELTGHLILYSV